MRRRFRWIAFVALILAACSPTRGCIESSFTLAPDSRLPKWFASAGAAREHGTVTMDYWSGPIGSSAVFILADARSGQRIATVSGTLRDHEPQSLLSHGDSGPIGAVLVAAAKRHCQRAYAYDNERHPRSASAHPERCLNVGIVGDVKHWLYASVLDHLGDVVGRDHFVERIRAKDRLVPLLRGGPSFESRSPDPGVHIEVALGERAPGTGFQIPLESRCDLLFGKLYDDVHPPRPVFARVAADPLIVLGEPRAGISGEANVVPLWRGFTLEDVHEASVCRHAGETAKLSPLRSPAINSAGIAVVFEGGSSCSGRSGRTRNLLPAFDGMSAFAWLAEPKLTLRRDFA